MKRLSFSALLLGSILYTPQVFAQTKCNDNAQQDARRAGHGDYGYETCKQGYVWRGAAQDDKVCVTPAIRDQANYDNSQAHQRVQQ